MVENLLKICFWGVAPIFQPVTPPNVIATDDTESDSHILVTTGRRGMVYGSKCAEIPCSYLCEENFLFLTQKKLQRKNKITTIFGKFF